MELSSSFPEGLRVLVVDDDTTCLKIVVKMLQKCKYSVTACDQPNDALSLLREKREDFDIVITDVRMPDMDGFKLLEHILLELDIQSSVMMSADSERDTVLKGLNRGACFYLAKPVRVHELASIWQHVARKMVRKASNMEPIATVEENEVEGKSSEDVAFETSINEREWKKGKKKRRRSNVKECNEEEQDGEDVHGRNDEKEDNQTEDENASMHKKARILWSTELHEQFLEAVNRIGIDRAVPKRILDIMKVPGLTRENIASHLQKYRLYLKKVEEAKQYGPDTFQPLSRASSRSVFGPLPNLRPSRPSIFDHSGPTLGSHTYAGLLNPYAPMAMSSINHLLSRFSSRQQQHYQPGSINDFIANYSTPDVDNDSFERIEPIGLDPTIGGNPYGGATHFAGCNEFPPGLGFCGVGLDMDTGPPQLELGEPSNVIDYGSGPTDAHAGVTFEEELEKIINNPLNFQQPPQPQQQQQHQPQQQLNDSYFTWDDLNGFDGGKSFMELIATGSYPPSDARAGDESLADALRGFLGESSSLPCHFSNYDLREVDGGNNMKVADQGSTST